MSKKRVLVSLYKGYGLGDSVQMSCVLQHIRKYRPDWIVDYQAEEGKHQIGRGLVENHFAYGELYPSEHYDAEVQLILYNRWYGWSDRPNTRVSSCLHERLDLNWDRECSRYIINVSTSVKNWAIQTVPNNSIGFHYLGDSAYANKNLSFEQADLVRETIRELGYFPYIMGRHIPKGYDAEVNTAIISECKAFIGIDSGPGKCASATDTPSLIVWIAHHPAEFHDPAPNTTHLVPENYHSLHPVCNDSKVIKFFEENYNIIKYKEDPVEEIGNWLKERFK